MVSRRFIGVEPSLIRRYFEVVSYGKDVIDLTIGQPFFEPPREVIEEYVRVLKSGGHRYGPNAGLFELRDAICRMYVEDWGLNYDPRFECTIVCGASEGILCSLLAVVEEGDRVLVPDPGYVQYRYAVKIVGGKPTFYHLKFERGFQPDIEELKNLASKFRPKAIILNSPCNPTSTIIRSEVLKAICDIAVDYGMTIISDEVYDRIVYNGYKHISPAKYAYDNTIIVNSFSKAFAMAGFRVGFVLAPKHLMNAIYLAHCYNTNCAGKPEQYAAIKAIEVRKTFLSRTIKWYEERRSIVLNILGKLKDRFIPPEGAFYIFLRVDDIFDSSIKFVDSLIEKVKVACVPGKAFGEYADKFVRISFSTDIKSLKEGLSRIVHFIESI